MVQKIKTLLWMMLFGILGGYSIYRAQEILIEGKGAEFKGIIFVFAAILCILGAFMHFKQLLKR